MAANTDRLRSQLIDEKAFYKYDYGNAALDPWLTDQLLTMLDSKGITDIRNIAFFNGIVPMVVGGDLQYVNTAYYYDALTGNTIDGLGGVISPDALKTTFAHVENSDYVFTYWIRYTADNTPYFLIQLSPKQHQSFWMQFREVLPVIMAVVSLAVPGLGAAIGQAVLGDAAAVYPGLASSIGRVAISAASNGGNIEGAIVSSLGGEIGAGVGGVVGGYTDIDALAKVAASVTSAAVTGGDLKTSVAYGLLQSGANFASTPLEAPKMDDSFLNAGGDWMTAGNSTEWLSTPTVTPAVDVSMAQYLDNTSLSVDLSGVNVPVDAAGTTAPALATGQPSSVDAAGVNWDKVVNSVSQVALTTLKVLPAFLQAGHPPIKVGSTSVAADGSTTTVSANGTITTHYANGRTSTVPTAAGQPYFLVDGSTVINNGNGTYTVIHANGQSATMTYSNSVLGGGLLFALIGGAALLILAR